MSYHWCIEAGLRRQPLYVVPLGELGPAVLRRAPGRPVRTRTVSARDRRSLRLVCDVLDDRFADWPGAAPGPAIAIAVVRAKLGHLLGPTLPARASSFWYEVAVQVGGGGVGFAVGEVGGEALRVEVWHAPEVSRRQLLLADRALWRLLLQAPLEDFHATFRSGAPYGCFGGQPYAVGPRSVPYAERVTEWFRRPRREDDVTERFARAVLEDEVTETVAAGRR
ncbi:MAG: hypothetical protein R3F59_34900 [Myxococcota bacterium]